MLAGLVLVVVDDEQGGRGLHGSAATPRPGRVALGDLHSDLSIDRRIGWMAREQ